MVDESVSVPTVLVDGFPAWVIELVDEDVVCSAELVAADDVVLLKPTTCLLP